MGLNQVGVWRGAMLFFLFRGFKARRCFNCYSGRIDGFTVGLAFCRYIN
jgi:hypothetical protein